jgi:L-ribulokinase
MSSIYVIGVDFGTDSVRALLIDATNGAEVSSSTFYYPRWKAGLFSNPQENRFRQHPLDYIEGIEFTIKESLKQAGNFAPEKVRAISIDTTGSTPVAVNKQGTPLALLDEFKDNPNAMFILWKDHTSVEEAALINRKAKDFVVNYLQYVGGVYSSEWYWAKLLHILREDEKVRSVIAGWVEAADWIPFLLTGGDDINELKRGVCTAGHKGLWAEGFGGYPPNDFFKSLDPLLDGFADKLPKKVYEANEAAGTLSKEWGEKLGLPTNVLVGIGAMDAHMGCVGGEIEPYYLSKVMGTSTCDMLVAPVEDIEGKLVKGICGQVKGSIIPGLIGLEAGQSAFGDTYAWFKKILSYPLQKLLEKTEAGSSMAITLQQQMDNILSLLTNDAKEFVPEEHLELAIDWLNGRRTPDANQELKSAIINLNLASDAPAIFRSLTEATCFGARAIVERFIEEGLPIKGIIGIGGVAKKNAFIMQQLADITGLSVRVHRSEQTCALGAAMFAATVAGIYPNVQSAMKAMGQGFKKEYFPNVDYKAVYDKRYQTYRRLAGFIDNKK